MKRALLILFILCTVVLTAQPVRAQVTPTPPLAECDVCGYCLGQEAPANWNACAQCRYPGIVTNSQVLANTNGTLAIDPITQRAKQPAGGKYYTQLGCLDTGLTSFRNDSGAVGATINFILSKLLFPIAGTLAFGGIIFGAFLLLTAQGEQEKILRGKRLITSSIVGVIFTFSSIFIINFIAGDVLRIPGFAKGTKVTFVGYGTATTENGKQIYPNISVFYDGKEVGKIDALKGAENSKETRTIYLPKELNLTSNEDIKKVRFVFTNDLCLSRNSPGYCCQVTSPHPLCLQPSTLYDGDRNINNYSIFFNDRPCILREIWLANTNDPNDDALHNQQANPIRDNSSKLYNNWASAYYICSEI